MQAFLSLAHKKVFLLLFALPFFCSTSMAQLSEAKVRMQSGELIRLGDLPWFKIARGLHVGRNRFSRQGDLYDWAIYSPPSFCPFRFFWRVNTQSSFTSAVANDVGGCNAMMRKSLEFLPDEVAAVCSCKILLLSEQIRKIGQDAILKSFDDSILLSDEIRFQRFLKSGADSLPVIFAVGSQGGAIYDYRGNQICKNKSSAAVGSSASGFMENLYKGQFEKRIEVQCLGGRSAIVDLSEISFNSMKFQWIGSIRLIFANGEKYEISE